MGRNIGKIQRPPACLAIYITEEWHHNGVCETFGLVKEHTAGSPQHAIRWTNLRPPEIAKRLRATGLEVSGRIVRPLLKKHGFVSRQAQKKKSFKQHPERNPPFENITALKARYLAANQPVLSMDTQKKELLGNFYRSGKLYPREIIEVLDHDFPSYSEGKVVPHGLYDIGLNKAPVNRGTSRDTTEFACDSVARWGGLHGRRDHPQATQWLILCDGGAVTPRACRSFSRTCDHLPARSIRKSG